MHGAGGFRRGTADGGGACRADALQPALQPFGQQPAGAGVERVLGLRLHEVHIIRFCYRCRGHHRVSKSRRHFDAPPVSSAQPTYAVLFPPYLI